MKANRVSLASYLFILAAVCVGMAVSDETRAQKRSKFEAPDFVFDLMGAKPKSSGTGGTASPLTVSEFPSLSGEGVSQTLFHLEACSINLPHNHPRATEILYAIDADNLEVGFVEENGGRVLVNNIKTGFTTFFPRGLIHFQQNLSCRNATYISSLNSEDPGVVSVVEQTFMFPPEALSATLNIDENQVNTIKSGLPKTPAPGFKQSECMKRCGLAYF